MQIPAGVILDRFGIHRLLCLAALLVAIASTYGLLIWHELLWALAQLFHLLAV